MLQNIYLNETPKEFLRYKKFTEHVLARRMSSMEIMYLLLSKRISDSSSCVIYLPTDTPSTRTKAVLPIHMIEEGDDDPYYIDSIENTSADHTVHNSTI